MEFTVLFQVLILIAATTVRATPQQEDLNVIHLFRCFLILDFNCRWIDVDFSCRQKLYFCSLHQQYGSRSGKLLSWISSSGILWSSSEYGRASLQWEF